VILALCLLLMLAFIASLRWTVILSIWGATIAVGNGGVMVLWSWRLDPGINIYDSRFAEDPSVPDLCWWPTLESGLFPWNRTAGLTCPIWMIVVSLTLLARLLSHLARRIPPGHCEHCGYNLTGNVSGRCPECGTAIKREGQVA
jgi:hypothetical protein